MQHVVRSSRSQSSSVVPRLECRGSAELRYVCIRLILLFVYPRARADERFPSRQIRSRAAALRQHVQVYN